MNRKTQNREEILTALIAAGFDRSTLDNGTVNIRCSRCLPIAIHVPDCPNLKEVEEKALCAKNKVFARRSRFGSSRP